MPSDVTQSVVFAPQTRTPLRLVLGLIIGAALIAGYFVTTPDLASHAAAQAGPELTRLMRGMAAIKALMALAAGAAIFWRLGAPATLPWFAAYSLVGAAMAAGPGLIWNMEYLRTGALLLHGGLFAAVILLWRDPAMGHRLEAAIARRRAALRT